jgi:hypothetical protein
MGAKTGKFDAGRRREIMLSERELATVLAALRHWQNSMPKPFGTGDMLAVPFGFLQELFEDHSMLQNEEIDDLCERLNTAGGTE